MLVTLVMKRAPGRSCKLTPKLYGPFLVTARCNGNKSKILDLFNNISEVHSDRLKKVSASFSPAAVPSPPARTTDSSPSEARFSPSSYWLRSAEHA